MKNTLKMMLILALPALCLAPAAAQQQITPPAPIQVNSAIITINSGPNDQTDPHVDKDFAAYTDVNASQIRYFSFSTGLNLAIPLGPSVLDILPDVSGGRIAFSRIERDRNAIMVFDIATSSLTEIDPHVGSNRIGGALGGNTLVYMDGGSYGNGGVYVYDLAANPPAAPLLLTGDSTIHQNPNVSPDGNTVVWEQCAVSIVNCNIFEGRLNNGVWTVSAVANTPDPEANPDTDGTWIVYDASRTGNPTGQDIYFRAVAGSPEFQLALPGDQQNPSIKNGFIGFESRADGALSRDIFVYDIANNILYQVTSTPSVNETLNNISVLDNGDIRMAWASNDGAAGDEDIHATTFTPSTRPSTTSARFTTRTSPRRPAAPIP